MGFSKDDENEETKGLSLVNGGEAPDSGADKATSLKLVQLRTEHRELDAEIETLLATSSYDVLHLTRLKKRKLLLRDQITRIEDEILPDIIA